MMRYHRVSPNCISLPNKRPKHAIRPIKDSDSNGTGSANLSPQTQENNSFSHLPDPKLNSTSSIIHQSTANGTLLRWGHKKRSRAFRSENRTVADESTSTVHSRQHGKIQRRAAIAGAEKIAAAAALHPSTFGFSKGSNLRTSLPNTAHSNHRAIEERSSGHHRSDKRSPSHIIKNSTSLNGFEASASASMNPDQKSPSDQGSGHVEKEEKLNFERFEWPRIYVSLSRKEKEEDFLAMKGTKLPNRPKKRAKNVDRSLQYCFPGMYLSDLTRARYEVREKKCAKKRRRGLKGMESMDSESE